MASVSRFLVCRDVSPKGTQQEEALSNIQDAIQDYLAAIKDLSEEKEIYEIEIAA